MRALFAITIVAAASISGAWSAMAQYGPARNPNPYGYYGYNEYSGYYARPRYGQIIHTTVKRLTMFSAIPSHTMATRVGASGDSQVLGRKKPC